MQDVRSHIGSGTYGRVYVHDFCRERVAIKEYKRSEDGDFGIPHDLVREMAVYRRMPWHENVVHAIHTEWEGGTFRVLLPLATGTVWNIIPSTEEVALRCATQIMAGVRHLHSHGCVHRDIKPNNILMFGDECRITDFGSAVFTTALPIREWGLTTFKYAAPEVLRSRPYGPEADVWSVGVVCGEIITDAHMFGGHTEKEVYESILERWDRLSQRLPRPLIFMLKLHPALRPVTGFVRHDCGEFVCDDVDAASIREHADRLANGKVGDTVRKHALSLVHKYMSSDRCPRAPGRGSMNSLVLASLVLSEKLLVGTDNMTQDTENFTPTVKHYERDVFNAVYDLVGPTRGP